MRITSQNSKVKSIERLYGVFYYIYFSHIELCSIENKYFENKRNFWKLYINTNNGYLKPECKRGEEKWQNF